MKGSKIVFNGRTGKRTKTAQNLLSYRKSSAFARRR